MASKSMWSVQDAKAKLCEVMRRVRQGKRQVAGARQPVVVSADQFNAAMREKHGGRFLVDSAPRGVPLELPPRGPDRADPFTGS